MIFIIEGPDGSGKTTLANSLSAMTGYSIVHRSTPKSQEEKDHMMTMYLQAIKEGKNMIWDRAWYSEIVYGTIMRDASVISYPQMYELERLLAKRGSVIVYCYDTPKVLWQRCQLRGEKYITDYDTHKAICDMFNEVMNMPHLLPVLQYGIKDM